mmetsp:Transcript_68491/g.191946  ORF Transcript_68491/g.191946 Transcript_68491/m.191946 type:complete len:330 (+) Transcript_68491:2070-3059(+)
MPVPRKPNATLHRPLGDGAVAELDIVRVLLAEQIDPIEESGLWQAYGEHHLWLAALCNLRRRHLNILCGGICQHATSEGQSGLGDGAEVDMQHHVSEGHCREQGLPTQAFGDGLRGAHPLAIPEEADRVRIWARRVQIQEHAKDLSHAELHCGRLPLALCGQAPFVVKADAVGVVSQDQCRNRRRETDSQKLPWLRSFAALGLGRIHKLCDHDLEHVASGLDPGSCPYSGEKVLEPALCQRREEVAETERHNVQRRVLRAHGHCAGSQSLSLVRRGVVLQLRRLILGSARIGNIGRRFLRFRGGFGLGLLLGVGLWCHWHLQQEADRRA